MATITYCDVPLLIPGDDVLQWMSSRYPIGNLHAPPIDFSPKLLHVSRPGPIINLLYWPTGASRWGQFAGLADDDSVADITAAAKTKRLAGETPTLILEATTKHGETLRTTKLEIGMHMVSPRPLTVDDGTRLWMIPLVDQRYWWRFMSTGELSVVSGGSWSTLIDDLETALGVTIDYAAPSSDYLTPDPIACTKEHADIPHLLDAVAHSVGMRVICQLNGDVELQGWSAGESRLDDNLGLSDLHSLAGDEYSDQKWSAPENVLVSCPKIRHYVPRIDGDRYSYTVAPDSTLFDADNGEVETGTVKRIQTAAYADFTGAGGTPDNNTDLDTLADKIAEDYYLSLKRCYRFMYGGLIQWNPSAYDYLILWSLRDSEISTTIKSAPANLDLEYMLHQDPQTVYDTLIKQGKADETIEAGASGPVSIYEDEQDTGDNVTAHLDWAHSDERVTAQKEVIVHFWHDQDRWGIIGKECEDS